MAKQTIADRSTSLEAQDRLSARLAQLNALLAAVAGEGFETFETLNQEHQQNYLWACASLAGECKALTEAL